MLKFAASCVVLLGLLVSPSVIKADEKSEAYSNYMDALNARIDQINLRAAVQSSLDDAWADKRQPFLYGTDYVAFYSYSESAKYNLAVGDSYDSGSPLFGDSAATNLGYAAEAYDACIDAYTTWVNGGCKDYDDYGLYVYYASQCTYYAGLSMDRSVNDTYYYYSLADDAVGPMWLILAKY